jgi:hypothetical protein
MSRGGKAEGGMEARVAGGASQKNIHSTLDR